MAVLATGCPVCGGKLQTVQTKSKAGVAQFAGACATHGRCQTNWYATEATAITTAPINPKNKVKWAAPV